MTDRHTITCVVSAMTGIDRWWYEGAGDFPFALLLRDLAWLLLWWTPLAPTRMGMVRRAARAQIRGPYKGLDLVTNRLIIQVPFGSYELAPDGTVHPVQHHESVPAGT